jgi:serine/threonine protein kinase
MSEEKFEKLYTLRGEVQPSTNTGMVVVFCERKDGLECVVKRRDRKTSFKRPSDEREWAITTEVQANFPEMESLCQLLDLIVTPTNYYVVMEKVEGTDLFELMSREKLAQSESRDIVFQIIDALREFHEVGRIHKDLKMENVMVDMNSIKSSASPGGYKSTSSPRGSPGRAKNSISSRFFGGGSGRTQSPEKSTSPPSPSVKLIDFDTVENWEPSSGESPRPRTRDVLGTDGYIAPEAYGGEYSPASDIYCAGVIMYKMLTRKFPHHQAIFDDKPGENWVGSPAMLRIMERLKNASIDFTKRPLDEMPEATDLCMSLLAYDPAARPSAREALRHPWFLMKLDPLD